jgi:hypothetical protein
MGKHTGRFTRITAEEAQNRIKPAPQADAFRKELAEFFATLQPLEYYELHLQPTERRAIVRKRLLQYAQEHNIECMHVRAGRNDTLIVWQGRSQRGQWDWEAAEAPADLSPGAEEGVEALQPEEAAVHAAAATPGKPVTNGIAPPPPEIGQSIMASVTAPQENQEG